MTERRRYTKRQKLTAVLAAEMTTVRGAAEGAGVPESTLRYWMDDPKFAQYRAKTREDLAKGMEMLAHATQESLMAKVNEMEPRDLITLMGVATDKSQLLVGAATARLESKDITNDLNDHERAQLSAILDGILEEPAPPDTAVDPLGAGTGVRE